MMSQLAALAGVHFPLVKNFTSLFKNIYKCDDTRI